MRDVDRVQVTPGTQPEVRFEQAGAEHRLACRMVIGADGRTSSVRMPVGIPLHQAASTHLLAGMLVDGVSAWPRDEFAIGTQGDVMFFIFPQSEERVRLHTCTALDQRDRFAGPNGQTRFLDTFRLLSAVPLAEAIADGVPVGPCATLTGEDSWTDVPFVEGVALIGDAEDSRTCSVSADRTVPVWQRSPGDQASRRAPVGERTTMLEPSIHLILAQQQLAGELVFGSTRLASSTPDGGQVEKRFTRPRCRPALPIGRPVHQRLRQQEHMRRSTHSNV